MKPAGGGVYDGEGEGELHGEMELRSTNGEDRGRKKLIADGKTNAHDKHPAKLRLPARPGLVEETSARLFAAGREFDRNAVEKKLELAFIGPPFQVGGLPSHVI